MAATKNRRWQLSATAPDSFLLVFFFSPDGKKKKRQKSAKCKNNSSPSDFVRPAEKKGGGGTIGVALGNTSSIYVYKYKAQSLWLLVLYYTDCQLLSL